jgi:hypothetical protein
MSASPVSSDSSSVDGHYLDHALVDGDVEGLEHFVARVLRRAHQSAEARNAPGEARAILDVAHLFADEWIAGNPGFDRFGFVAAATEGPS